MNRIEGIQIIADSIMDNHAHILIYTDTIQNMQSWMKRCNTSYAMYYNKCNDRVGYVFRERYKAKPIKNERHLYVVINYIHNNPVKAGLCKNKTEYKFSSYSSIYHGNQLNIYKRINNIINQNIPYWEQEVSKEDELVELIEDESETKEEICRNVINRFIENQGINEDILKNEIQYLKEIIKILKCENNISYRIMEKCLEISREKLRRLNL